MHNAWKVSQHFSTRTFQADERLISHELKSLASLLTIIISLDNVQKRLSVVKSAADLVKQTC